jgi:hypothetical protein
MKFFIIFFKQCRSFLLIRMYVLYHKLNDDKFAFDNFLVWDLSPNIASKSS